MQFSFFKATGIAVFKCMNKSTACCFWKRPDMAENIGMKQ
jgi:hypothetical protein